MIDNILEVSKEAPDRHILYVLAKLMEEVGELAQEININEGFINKPHGKDGIIGECVDIINCCVDIIYLNNNNISKEEIEEISNNKLNKWKSHFS